MTENQHNPSSHDRDENIGDKAREIASDVSRGASQAYHNAKESIQSGQARERFDQGADKVTKAIDGAVGRLRDGLSKANDSVDDANRPYGTPQGAPPPPHHHGHPNPAGHTTPPGGPTPPPRHHGHPNRPHPPGQGTPPAEDDFDRARREAREAGKRFVNRVVDAGRDIFGNDNRGDTTQQQPPQE